MLAGPTSTLWTMAHAIAITINAFDAAAELDLDRTDDDRAFFASRKALLLPHKPHLGEALRAIEDHDLNVGSRLQARVEMGDRVLDGGVSTGNARTKLALKGKAGLDASHVFGKNVATLTKEKIALEPQKVLHAVERLNDLPEFAERAAIAADLTKRAEQQQDCLDDREDGHTTRQQLVSVGIKRVLDAANALAAAKGALDERFPRQRDYVSAFFLDVSPERTKATEPVPGEPAAAGG